MSQSCKMLDAWGLFVQALLALVAFTSLVVKRYTETPRRPWTIWWMDSSKQGLASTIVHFLNVGFSKMFSSSTDDSDSCSWYFLEVILDATFGLMLVYLMLKVSAAYIAKRRWKLLYSGDYGRPPTWKPWLYQTILYNLIAIIGKLIVTSAMLLPFWPQVGKSLLFGGHLPEKVEVMIAMFVAPLIINAIWFWVVDNILMKAETAGPRPQHKGDEYIGAASDFDILLHNMEGDDDSDEELVI